MLARFCLQHRQGDALRLDHGAHWHDFAKDIGVNYRYVQAALKRMASGIITNAEEILKEMAPQMDKNERALLERLVALVRAQASYASEAARTIATAARAARGSRD